VTTKNAPGLKEYIHTLIEEKSKGSYSLKGIERTFTRVPGLFNYFISEPVRVRSWLRLWLGGLVFAKLSSGLSVLILVDSDSSPWCPRRGAQAHSVFPQNLTPISVQALFTQCDR
jgi:hypothetical protein